jgi:outer membrane protein assembly factor BamB
MNMKMNRKAEVFSSIRLWTALFALFLLANAPAIPGGEPSDPGTGDWPMWGGTADRNMVSDMEGLPTTWDIDTGEGIKWSQELGSQTYGNPVVAEGMLFVGTNNETPRDPAVTGDKGVLYAFSESDGEFLWQLASDKLQQGRVNDWPYQGVCSSPLVEDGVLYYANNRSEVVAVNIRARDAAGKPIPEILWSFDMMEELGNHPHNMTNSSPVIFGDLLYINTANGQDETHVNVPSPRAPSIITLNKKTGELVWEDDSPGENILHGQWSTPTIGEVDGVVQAINAQGDGWIRGFVAETGEKLWEFNTNSEDSVWPRTRNELISTPVFYDGLVYIANGQDPEHGEGVGHLYAIDPTKRGDITESGRVWHYSDIRRSISTPSIRDGILYIPDFSGFVHALDAKTGEQIWKYDMLAAMWGSTMLAGGNIYLGDEDGDLIVMEEGREMTVVSEINMGSSVYSTPVPANGVLYIATRNMLYAIDGSNEGP